MTPDDVRIRVAKIAAVASDYEVAHGLEGELYHDVLTAISSGDADAAELAREALRTKSIAFARYTA